jgi:hypothetical protein
MKNNDNRSASYTKALFEDNTRFRYHGNVILSDTQNMQTFILIKKKSERSNKQCCYHYLT